MNGICYEGVIEGYRQALITAAYRVASPLNSSYIDLKCALTAETRFSEVVDEAKAKFSTTKSKEAKEFIVKRINDIYLELVAIVTENKSYEKTFEDIKASTKEFFKGQSHKNDKGGGRYGQQKQKQKHKRK